MKSMLWIGVDVSKDSFHAAYRQGTGFCEAEFLQNEAAMQAFGNGSLRVAMCRSFWSRPAPTGSR